jgi:hypothetical protein
VTVTEKAARDALAAWDRDGGLSRALTVAERLRELLAELQNERDRRRAS